MPENDCPFCEIINQQNRSWVGSNDYFVAFRDKYPVSEGHTLIIPRAHVTTISKLDTERGQALLNLLQSVRKDLLDTKSPDGFNVGLNEGTAAGQTIEHLHWHVIPRYRGDVEDPEGGVRGVIPSRRRYR